jgi:flavin reductase (DIM6/NTAB) family NADH-FMN oxidoreductase RutF
VSGRRIAIVGAGQSGLQLALGLLNAGHEVTLVSERRPEQVAEGRVLSSQCMFASALETERILGIDFWRDEAPQIAELGFAVSAPEISWSAPLDAPAQSVDQRVKMPRWMEEVERRGGRLEIREADADDLELLARTHELVVVSTGRGTLGGLFAIDRERSPFETPQRALALTYLRDLEPRQGPPRVVFSIVPGVGECIVLPALTWGGPCEIVVMEGVIGGPMDCWSDVRTPEDHLRRTLELLERFVPWEAARCRGARLTDEHGILTGRVTPTVRRPVAHLASGAPVLGMADAVVLNDPVTGQGSNNAARCAELYLESILGRGDEPFDEAWMERAFEHYWRGYAQWVVGWTNALLAPTHPRTLRLLRAAQEVPGVASALANGFDDPRTLYPWWFDDEQAERFVELRRREGEGLDMRDLRRALGQFATGVTVITTRADTGRTVGVTANSFTSVSLDPPLVLWCLDRSASCLDAFRGCTHFGVSILSASQHHLSRRFSTKTEDKFAGCETVEGQGGIPLLAGATAHFVCRNVRQLDAGDHLIVIGEVERYEVHGGEPLVFHAGAYHVATRHPDVAV